MLNFKQCREKFIEKHPSGMDDSKAPEFYQKVIENFEIKESNQKIAFIVVAHFVHSLPYFLEALSSLGPIVALISKQSGVVKTVRKSISEIYKDIIFTDINKNSLANNPLIAQNFFSKLIDNSIWQDYQFIILDHGGYFAPRIHDVLNKFNPLRENLGSLLPSWIACV